MFALNETHDPALKSWVDTANLRSGDFPIQNLPFGVFRRRGIDEAIRVGVAIGDQILDLSAVHAAKIFSGQGARAAGGCAAPALNDLMAMGANAWSALRLELSRALREHAPEARELRGCLVAQSQAEH